MVYVIELKKEMGGNVRGNIRAFMRVGVGIAIHTRNGIVHD